MTETPALLFVTGTRADFGLWVPVLEAAERAGMRPRLLVTAMHLDERFGLTVEEVRASGHAIAAEVPSTAEGDTRAEMSVSLGRAIQVVTPVLEAEQPDRLLVLGDRGEQLAAGLAAMHLGVPVAHVHGGERTAGAVDDTIRDLLSRIASLHLTATEAARDELLRLGVDPGRIEVTGAPGLDVIAARSTAADAAIRGRYGVGGGAYLVVAQHPETVGDEDPVGQLGATLGAVERIGLPAVAILANADAGGRRMGGLLEGANSELLHVHRSIPHLDFLALLAGAAAIVGNSSSGIIEAPMLGVPAINVGRRQDGRTRGDNVIDVPAERDAIMGALQRALTPGFRSGLSHRSPYGDGHAAERIVSRLAIDIGGKA